MRRMRFGNGFLCAVALASSLAGGRNGSAQAARGEVRLRLSLPGQAKRRPVPSVIWLEAADGTPALPFVSRGRYALLQKNRMFNPHLLVVPVGSTVIFPNADPFFHNVFSLFDGKRFDLGLYEAGSSKEVPFTREGVSYIFCNIHPQMSAVVIALSTPLYAVADDATEIALHDVPPGSYSLHVWVEGINQTALDRLTQHVRVSSGALDLGDLRLPDAPLNVAEHTNKFGQAYDQDSKTTY
jgi:hypothetical protein